MRRKTGQVNTTVFLVVVLISTFLIFSLISLANHKTAEAASPLSCRTTNVLRANTQIEVNKGPLTIQKSIGPQACKTTQEVVTGGPKAAMQQVAEMITDCWWQFGNGEFDNLLCDMNSLGPAKSCGTDKCFVCYTFTVQAQSPGSDQPTFNGADLRAFMAKTPKYYEDPDTGQAVADPNTPTSKGKMPVPVSYLQYLQYDQRGLLVINGLGQDQSLVFKPGTQSYSVEYVETHQGVTSSTALANTHQEAIYVHETANRNNDVCSVQNIVSAGQGS